MNCPFCNKELKSCTAHVIKCKKNTNNLTSEECWELYIKYNFGEDVFEKIIEDYCNLYSFPMLKSKYGISYKGLYKILKKFNIKIRGISESQKKISVPKSRETCMKKYGVDNVSKRDEIKKKKADTFIKHYDVDNIWKTDWYKEFTSKRWASYTPEKKTELLKQWRNSKGRTSILENKVIGYLNELNISIITQFKFDDYYHAYDILINDTNIIIEVNGDFWHGNPKIYKSDDYLNFPNYKVKVEDLWKKDKLNYEYAKNRGYNVVVLWESDINKKSKDEIIEQILKEAESYGTVLSKN